MCSLFLFIEGCEYKSSEANDSYLDYWQKLANEKSIQVGSKEVVPNWEWVTVVDEASISKGEDFCGVQPGGLIVVKEFRKDKLLVEYSAPGSSSGTPCPSGVQFLLSRKQFLAIRAEGIRSQLGDEDMMLHAKRLHLMDSIDGVYFYDSRKADSAKRLIIIRSQ
jgi:hypothetical protein